MSIFRVTTEGATTFVFVSDGIESATDQAHAAAGDRDVAIAGGAEVAQQYLRAGLVDEMHPHVVPVFLGSGRRFVRTATSRMRRHASSRRASWSHRAASST